jgi:hypothetical protein
MGELNCLDSHRAAYHQEVRRLEEKFDDFELHHILRWDKEAADTLVRLGSSREQPPSGVFMQDLIKATIWLEKDITAPSPGTLPGEGGPAPTPEIDSKTPTRPTVQAREPRTEIAAITRPPGSNTDWRKPISEYLCLGAIPDDENETRYLARQAKGYLMHDNKHKISLMQ